MIQSFGQRGEELAVAYLKGRGYAILHRNYRTPLGEADIIARHEGALVFIEVKARSTVAFGQPFEAVDLRKQEKLKKIALYYVKHKKVDAPVRFDVISIIAGNGKEEIKHIREAF
ncbi:MAG: YraN family protein [Nitrospirota bacterium]